MGRPIGEIMISIAVYVARLPCGCAIDACEECLDEETLAVCLYHWRGNGYTVERVEGNTPIKLDCADCEAINEPRYTKMMF